MTKKVVDNTIRASNSFSPAEVRHVIALFANLRAGRIPASFGNSVLLADVERKFLGMRVTIEKKERERAGCA